MVVSILPAPANTTAHPTPGTSTEFLFFTLQLKMKMPVENSLQHWNFYIASVRETMELFLNICFLY